LGAPAKVVRDLTEEEKKEKKTNALDYKKLAIIHTKELYNGE